MPPQPARWGDTSGHGFALCFPLLFASLTGRSGPGLSLLA